tara:strand:+ start:1102 stop:1599 length:498 start_codon:yes stop_codon:yes gene_type:complete
MDNRLGNKKNKIKRAREPLPASLRGPLNVNKLTGQQRKSLMNMVDAKQLKKIIDAQNKKNYEAQKERKERQSRVDRGNWEGEQEDKSIAKSKSKPTGKTNKSGTTDAPPTGSTAKAGQSRTTFSRKIPEITVEEVKGKAKGGMVKKKRSVKKAKGKGTKWESKWG